MTPEQKEKRKLELKKKLLKLKKQEKAYEQNNKIEFFNTAKLPANPLQEELLAAFNDPQYKVFTYTGGNRIGKTTILSILCISYMIGKWPWSGEKVMLPHYKPRKIRIIGQDWEKHISKVLIPALEEWWPANRPVYKKKNNMGVDATWTDKETKSSLEIMSNNQDSDLHEGWYGDLVCIEENQRVLLADGRWVSIKDIEEGDKVWTVSNNHIRSTNKVLKKMDNGVRDIVEVTLKGGVKLKCTPDHEIYVRSSDPNKRDCKKQAKDLTPEDKVYCPLFETGSTTANDFYSYFDNFLFLTGAWIGDGWVSDGRVNYSTASDEFRDYLESKIPKGMKLVHRKKYDYEVQPSGNMLHWFLHDFGLADKKAHEKFIPDAVFTLDIHRKIEFIRGLIATDVWCIDKCIGYGSTSERLVRDFHKLLRSIGVHSTIQFKASQKPGVWRKQWFLNIGKSGSVLRLIDMLQFVPGKSLEVTENDARKRYTNKAALCRFTESIRGDCRAPEKSYRRSIQYHYVKSVEPAGEARVYDLTVENNHNFICECMKVSNCYDEPPKRDIRVANARGLIDRQGRELFSMTLLKEAWVDREVIKARNDDGTPDRMVYNVQGDIWSNVGFGITKEGVEQFSKLLSDDEKEARLSGKPSYLSGLVAKNFNRKIHLTRRFQIPLDWIVDIAIDIHPRKEQAVLFMATSPRNERYLFHEIWEHGDGKHIAEQIIRVVKRNALRVNQIVCDPLAKGDSNNDNTTFDKIDKTLSSHGYWLETATKDKTSGIIEINNHLMGPNGEPSLWIFDDLIRTTMEIEGWMYDKDTQKPQKTDDDMMENLYRLLLLDTVWEAPEDEDDDGYDETPTANSWTGY